MTFYDDLQRIHDESLHAMGKTPTTAETHTASTDGVQPFQRTRRVVVKTEVEEARARSVVGEITEELAKRIVRRAMKEGQGIEIPSLDIPDPRPTARKHAVDICYRLDVLIDAVTHLIVMSHNKDAEHIYAAIQGLYPLVVDAGRGMEHLHDYVQLLPDTEE